MAFGQINATGTAARVPTSGGNCATTLQNTGSAPVAIGDTNAVTFATGTLIYPLQSATFYQQTFWIITGGGTIDCRWMDSLIGS